MPKAQVARRSLRLVRRRLLKFIRQPKDRNVRFNLLLALGKWLIPDYRFKWAQMQWWEDAAFTEYLDQFNESEGCNCDRRWMLYQLLRLTAAVPGDTAECGVFRGAGSYLICLANRLSQAGIRQHHLFDSFEGLSEPAEVDGQHWTRGDLACSLRDVQANLAKFEHAVYHRGWIPDCFPAVADKRFSFVHIDVDLYQPTRDSIEFFYPRVSSGGVIVCDDYGFTSCPGATKAIDEFLDGKPDSMLSMSGGGGFMIKGCTTAPAALRAA